MKLLIVDDSSIMRRTIEKHIKELGVEVVGQASNGQQAIELVQEKKPDIVTLDVTMPEMDGITCLEKIMEIAPDTNVILVTALNDRLTGLKALDIGAVNYLNKPVSPEVLKEALDDIIEEAKN